VPSVNDLPIEVYDSSNISIVGGSDISGWFPATLTGFLMASLFLSNDTHILVADNHFESMGSSMVIVDPNGNRTDERNTVFGNRYSVSPVYTGPDGPYLYVVRAFNTSYAGPPTAGGLGVFSSGNTIYNNLFSTPITAYSPPQNPYLAYVFINDFGYTDFASVAAFWHNHWNVALAAASAVQYVNGFPLTGSIVGAPFEGGNAWSNWNGSVPYTDQGLLVAGGDDLPLPLHGASVHAVVWAEVGLPGGTYWIVSVDGMTLHSTGSMILAYLPAGTYPYSIPGRSGHIPVPSSGTVTLAHEDVLVTVAFT